MVYRESEMKSGVPKPKNIELIHGSEIEVHEKALKGQAKSHSATWFYYGPKLHSS